MIHVENLTFTYPNGYEPVFENVGFQIDTDWKLGLIGRNGRGKTTFLKLLSGGFAYRGTIQSSVRFDYFPYEIHEKERMTIEILQDICPCAREWEIIRELSYMEVRDDVLWRPFDTLSNGEQTKVMLAALFLNEGRFLLIDEPTNHLDVRAREIVAAYLNRKKGFILVSHDRLFLDGCIDHILAINRSGIEVQSGNFSIWFENFQRRQQFETGKNEKLKKEIVQMKKSARQTKNWSDAVEMTKRGAKTGGVKADKGYIGHKAAKMMQRSKNIETRRQKAIEEKSGLLKDLETVEDMKIFPLSYHTDRLVSLSHVSPVFGGRPVCSPVSFDIKQGDRIALCGKNGAGKSTILRLIAEHTATAGEAGNQTEYEGETNTGSRLILSYVPQDTSFLQGSLQEFAKKHRIDETLFKSMLRKLDFSRGQFDKNMEDFSAGQKKKVLLAKSLCEQAHLYVWDEPLNYIDIYSRMQIENLIRTWKPTMIFVEHDMAFTNEAATKIVHIQ